MEQAKINRINELYKKSKDVGLSKSEAEEQKALRAEYVDSIKRNFRRTLDNVEITD